MAKPEAVEGISPHKVDWPFSGWLVLICLFGYGGLVVSRQLLLVVVLLASLTVLFVDRTSTWSETFRTMALLPLGLGSILAFLSSDAYTRTRHLRTFTILFNLAAYVSVGMTIFVPAERTFRGWCGKIAGFWLFCYIVQQGSYVGWKTIAPHDKMLVFTAVTKGWIAAFAFYRYILLTLPSYGAGHRYRFLEYLSVAMTVLLSQASGLPLAHCWVMADMLVMPAAAGFSAIATAFELVPPMPVAREMDVEGDLFLAGLQLSVALIAAAGMFDAWVERSVELEKIEKAKNPKPKKPPPKPVTYETYEV